MEERIKAARKALGKTQTELADELRVAKGSIQAYEYGYRNPSSSFVQLFCERYGISEKWLTTGEGDMFNPSDKYTDIADFVRGLLQKEPDAFEVRLIAALAKLNAEQWEVLEHIAEELAKKDE